jgi:hypothetical protein
MFYFGSNGFLAVHTVMSCAVGRVTTVQCAIVGCCCSSCGMNDVSFG